jgi:hypothetical protein
MSRKALRVSLLYLLTVLVLIGGFIFLGCSDESDNGTEPEPDTTDPEVTVSASTYLVLDDGDVTYTAAATDNEGVVEVEFYEDSDHLATDVTPPFTHMETYAEADNGEHEIWAKAKDAAGNTADSDTIEVIVAINVTAGFTNPGFDTDGSGWTEHNIEAQNGWTGEAGNPPGCYQINHYGYAETNPGIEQEVSGFVPGLTYEISGEYRPYVSWIGNPNQESFVVTVDSVLVGSFPRGPNGLEWSPFVAEFTATEFTHTIGFWAEYYDDSSYELDNVSLSIKVTN